MFLSDWASFFPLCVAGTVMFEYGMRLGREVRTRLGLQRQVNCYLAALNCLRLIRPEYAWIVQPAAGATVPTHTDTHTHTRCKFL